MCRVSQLHEPGLSNLVVLCTTLFSKLLVLDKIQHILNTTVVMNLDYTWEAQCEVACIRWLFKASTNDLRNERAGESTVGGATCR